MFLINNFRKSVSKWPFLRTNQWFLEVKFSLIYLIENFVIVECVHNVKKIFIFDNFYTVPEHKMNWQIPSPVKLDQFS